MSVVVVSIDSLICEDLEYLARMKHMGPYLEKAGCMKVVPIYPTYTYPCHVSLVTGCYPDKTGVYHNCSFPGKAWQWDSSVVKVPTVFDLARRAGLAAAAVCWPVTGGADMDFLVPEAWAEEEGGDPDPVFGRLCSEAGFRYYLRHKDLLDWMRTPGMDLFASSCFCDIMRENDVDLAFVHFSYLDHQRHRNGVASGVNAEALSFIDERMGEVFSAAGDDAEIIVLGDHGQRGFSRFFSLRKLLDDMGLGERILVHSCSMSAQVYLSGIPEDEAGAILSDIMTGHPGLVERILTKSEAREHHHLSGSFSFVLEAADGVSFSDDMDKGVVFPSGVSHAAHGYLPRKGPFPPLCIKNRRLLAEWCDSVDIAPTVMSLFNVDMPCDGKVLEMA